MISERMLSLAVRMMNGHYLNMKPCAGGRLPKAKEGKPYMLYVHIPFCESLCPYCSFNRFPFEEKKARSYFEALRVEMKMVKKLGYAPESLYIGGGTPTILPDELQTAIRLAKELFPIKSVSCETNPNHLKPEYLDGLKGLVDRMSVGVQSFDDDLLKAMRRYEKYGSAEEIAGRLEWCAESGIFSTLNADMIFNFPTQTESMLYKDIEYIKRCGCNQTTFYPLMASPSVESEIKRSVGRVDYRKEKHFYDVICKELISGKDPVFIPGSAWTFNRKGGKGSGLIDEYVVDYEEYPAIGSGGMSYLNGRYLINTFDLKDYEKRIAEGKMSVSGSLRFGRRDRMRYRFMMQLFGLKLDKNKWRRDFGCSVMQGLPAEYLFLKAAGAFERDDEACITLTHKGRYLMAAMMRQFFIGVNSVRDEERKRAGIVLKTS